ncbi:MAG: hypothetical protein ACYS8W_06350 [Planctomycetota bacterium]|jgi:hypothetical protein
MTAQIPDTFLFRRRKYDLIGMTGDEELFDPRSAGMEPVSPHTACWRGFYATYRINKKGVFLDRLAVYLGEDGDYRPVNGITHVMDEDAHMAVYRKINLRIPFTGKMRLARDFIEELYVHMGFQKASAYRTVFDLTFEDGRLVAENDRSDEIEKKRGEFQKRYHDSHDIAAAIEEAFSLDMDLE